jgi:putative membrane protein
MVTWFAGLFYLPRLYVYHADAGDWISVERFRVMERRLFIIMTIGAILTLLFGSAMLVAAPGYLRMGWLHAKLMLVLLLIVYHAMCYKFLRDFAHDRRTHTAKWFRAFNEVPSVLLLGIVILAIVKPF